MNKNSLRNLITVLFCAGEGLHQFVPAIPLGVSTTIGLVIRAIMDQLWPSAPVAVDGKPNV